VMGPDGAISDRHGWTDTSADARAFVGKSREEARKAFDDLLLAMAFDRSSAGRNAGAGVPGVPQPRPVDLQSEWRSADQRRFEDNWNHFLRTQVDPLVVESDGLGFFDPSQIPVNSPMPIRLPKAYGFGLRFRMSF